MAEISMQKSSLRIEWIDVCKGVKNSWKKMNFKQRIYAKLAQIKVIKAIYNKLEQIPLVQKKFDKIQRDTWLK